MAEGQRVLSAVSEAEIDALKAELRARLRPLSGSLEEFAQECVDVIYQRFEAATVLVRAFATLSLGILPPRERTFASSLATSAVSSPGLNPDTQVLTLLGSRGDLPEWNGRERSQGHVAIPLLSPAFVDSAPMIARLLRELGAEVGPATATDSRTTLRIVGGGAAGMFYVEDARTGTDDKGRKVIAAQDFVVKHGVRTVLGVGGPYGGSKSRMIAIVLFMREHVTKDTANLLLPIATLFKAVTASTVIQGKIFK